MAALTTRISRVMVATLCMDNSCMPRNSPARNKWWIYARLWWRQAWQAQAGSTGPLSFTKRAATNSQGLASEECDQLREVGAAVVAEIAREEGGHR